MYENLQIFYFLLNGSQFLMMTETKVDRLKSHTFSYAVHVYALQIAWKDRKTESNIWVDKIQRSFYFERMKISIPVCNFIEDIPEFVKSSPPCFSFLKWQIYLRALITRRAITRRN